MPVDEPAVQFVAQNLDAISRIVPSVLVPTPEVFDIATDKWLLAQFLLQHHIPCPYSILFEKGDSIQKLETLPFPILIKPKKGHGGHGIHVFGSLDEIKKFVCADRLESNTSYVFQAYIDGYDIDCSFLAKEGKILAYTIQKGFMPRSDPYAAPAGISFLHQDEVLLVVTRMVRDLGFSGIAHVDLRYDTKARDFKIIEINARYWGSLTGSLLAGVNFPYLACLAGLGCAFELPTYESIRFIDHTAAAKHMMRLVLGKEKEPIGYRETDFPFIFSDPCAEVLNIVRRRSN
jgi:carbamoylphosphate synthase large subunit